MGCVPRRGRSWSAQVRVAGWKSFNRTLQTKSDGLQWINNLETKLHSSDVPDTVNSQKTTIAKLLEKYASEISQSHKSAGAVVARHLVGVCWQNQGTPSDDDTAILADNANRAANNPTRADCASNAYKRLRAVSRSPGMIEQIVGWTAAGVGQAYGDGIDKKWEWLSGISHSHPKSKRPNTQKPD